MDSKAIREKYLNFFKNHAHTVIPSAPLIPEDDPTTLFISAGMQPLIPFLLGEEHPQGKRLVNIQQCLRTDDIDEVGDPIHNTFLEMLGNWSLGDYWKKESISWSLEFLTKQLRLSQHLLSVTIFAGDSDAQKDEESFKIWISLGIPENRIIPLGKKDNWWGPVGKTGPCGPATEIFYWIGEGEPQGAPNINPNWVEIWNNVFMEYNKTADGKYILLKQKNVDTGMGLERITMVVQGKSNVYETDLFAPLYQAIEAKTKTSEIFSNRIIADATRASVFLISAGVEPSNVDRGYVLRRLIRRAVGGAYRSGIPKGFFPPLTKIIINQYSYLYPALKEKEDKIYDILNLEEERFQKPINWLEVYKNDLLAAKNKISIKRIGKTPILTEKGKASGAYVFENYQSYGVPPDLAKDTIKEVGLEFDQESFAQNLKSHQEKSRTLSGQRFAGGLADSSTDSTKLHTTTHLLHQSLRQILGSHIKQSGSNITPERLRFDFSHPQPLSPKQLKQVEQLVNEQIKKNLPVSRKIISPEQAQKEGALAFFAAKYGDRVKVYSIGDFSKEVCGGPHVESTKTLGSFKITKEESASSGIRRIYATLS